MKQYPIPGWALKVSLVLWLLMSGIFIGYYIGYEEGYIYVRDYLDEYIYDHCYCDQALPFTSQYLDPDFYSETLVPIPSQGYYELPDSLSPPET